MGFLGELPTGAIYFIFGFVFAAIAWVMSQLLPARFRIFIVSTALALSPLVARTYIIPPIILAHAVDVKNKTLPKQLGENTRLDRVSSEGKTFIFHYVLNDSFPADYDLTFVKTQGLAALCTDWANAFKSAIVSSVELRFLLHGQNKSVFVYPSECT
jgi:hypothetical protein